MPELEFDTDSEEFQKDPIAFVNKLHDEKIAGLKSKNAELISKMGKAKPDPETISELESLRSFKSQADILAEETKGNYEKAQKMARDAFEAKLKAANEKAAQATTQIESLLIDGGISDAISSVDVVSELREAAALVFKKKATIEDGKALIDGKPLNEFIKEWAKTDAAKPFLRAASNSGGNATGGGKTSTPKDSNPWSKETYNLTRQGIITLENPELAAQLKAQA